jgi:hypothetical protein
MGHHKNIDENSINKHIQFLTDTASLSRAKKINPRHSFRSEFLEKVKALIELDRVNEEQYTTNPRKVEYERYAK